MGYVRDAAGAIAFDPDEQVQHVVHLIFRKFDELGTLHALVRYLARQGIELGVRLREGPAKGTLEWRCPKRTTVQALLRNPIYAGAYAYGRRQVDGRKKRPGHPSSGRVDRVPQEYHVLLKDYVPAYISWEQYEQNIARLAGVKILFPVLVLSLMPQTYDQDGDESYSSTEDRSHDGSYSTSSSRRQ
jgi:hypothetical protein